MFYKKRSAGFTIVEALIGITILAVVTQLSLVAVREVGHSIESKHIVDSFKQLNSEIEIYYARNAGNENFTVSINDLQLSQSTIEFIAKSGIQLLPQGSSIFVKIPNQNTQMTKVLTRFASQKFDPSSGIYSVRNFPSVTLDYSNLLRLDGSSTLTNAMDLRGYGLSDANVVAANSGEFRDAFTENITADKVNTTSTSTNILTGRVENESGEYYWNVGSSAKLNGVSAASISGRNLSVSSANEASVNRIVLRSSSGALLYIDPNATSNFTSVKANNLTSGTGVVQALNYSGQGTANFRNLSLPSNTTLSGAVTGTTLSANNLVFNGSNRALTATSAVYADNITNSTDTTKVLRVAGTSALRNTQLTQNLTAGNFTSGTIQQSGTLTATSGTINSLQGNTLSASNVTLSSSTIAGTATATRLNASTRLNSATMNAKATANLASLQASGLNVSGTLTTGSISAPNGTLTASNAQGTSLRIGTNTIDPAGTSTLNNTAANIVELPVKTVGSACTSGELGTDGLGNFLTCKSNKYTKFAASSGGSNNIDNGVWTKSIGTWVHQGCAPNYWGGCSFNVAENTYTSDSLLIKVIVSNGNYTPGMRNGFTYINPIPSDYQVVSCMVNDRTATNPQVGQEAYQNLRCASTNTLLSTTFPQIDWVSWVADDNGYDASDPWVINYMWQMNMFYIYATVLAVRR